MSVQSQAASGPATPDSQPTPTGSSARGLSAATAVSLVFRVAGMCVGMVTTSILARHLEPAGYGMFALALTLGTAAAQLADLGIAATVASRIARDKQHAGRTLSTGVAIRTVVAVIATAGLLFAALQGYFGASSEIVAIVAIATPLSAASVLSAGSMARFRPQLGSALAFIQGVFWLGAVLTVSLTEANLIVLAWLFVIVTVLQTTIGIAMNRRIVPLGKPSLTEARNIVTASWPLAVSAVAGMVYFRLNSVILFQAQGATELGFYSAAFKFIEVAQLGPSLLATALLPVAAASLAAGAQRKTLVFSMAARMGLAIGAGTAVMLIVLAPTLITVLFGSSYLPATKPLMLLAIAFIGICLGWIGTTICTATGTVRPIAIISVPLAIVSLGAQIWVCPRWGATGAAAVSAGTELIMGISMCIVAARALSARLPVKQCALGLAAGAVIVMCTMLLALPWWLEAILAAGAFSASVFVFRLITTADIRRMLSKSAL